MDVWPRNLQLLHAAIMSICTKMTKMRNVSNTFSCHKELRQFLRQMGNVVLAMCTSWSGLLVYILLWFSNKMFDFIHLKLLFILLEWKNWRKLYKYTFLNGISFVQFLSDEKWILPWVNLEVRLKSNNYITTTNEYCLTSVINHFVYPGQFQYVFLLALIARGDLEDLIIQDNTTLEHTYTS